MIFKSHRIELSRLLLLAAAVTPAVWAEEPNPAAVAEAARILKPGGRILIADLVTEGPLPPDVRASAAAWADCLAGAMPKAAYLETIRQAGFAEVAVISESPYETPGMDERLLGQIISAKVRAVKGR